MNSNRSSNNKKSLFALGGLGTLAVVAWLAFGFFGIQSAFIDNTVDEAGPVFGTSSGGEIAAAGPVSTVDAIEQVEIATEEAPTVPSPNATVDDVPAPSTNADNTASVAPATAAEASDADTDAEITTVDSVTTTDATTTTTVAPTTTSAAVVTTTSATPTTAESATATTPTTTTTTAAPTTTTAAPTTTTAAPTTTTTAPPEEPGEVVTTHRGDFDGTSRYDVAGDALVLGNGTSQRFLRLEDFESDNGPDLKVYLRSASGDFVSLGNLKGNVGAQNYEIPANVDLSVFNTVEIWCERFSVGFGSAQLSQA